MSGVNIQGINLRIMVSCDADIEIIDYILFNSGYMFPMILTFLESRLKKENMRNHHGRVHCPVGSRSYIRLFLSEGGQNDLI